MGPWNCRCGKLQFFVKDETVKIYNRYIYQGFCAPRPQALKEHGFHEAAWCGLQENKGARPVQGKEWGWTLCLRS